jgi:hypothetical protein
MDKNIPPKAVVNLAREKGYTVAGYLGTIDGDKYYLLNLEGDYTDGSGLALPTGVPCLAKFPKEGPASLVWNFELYFKLIHLHDK